MIQHGRYAVMIWPDLRRNSILTYEKRYSLDHDHAGGPTIDIAYQSGVIGACKFANTRAYYAPLSYSATTSAHSAREHVEKGGSSGAGLFVMVWECSGGGSRRRYRYQPLRATTRSSANWFSVVNESGGYGILPRTVSPVAGRPGVRGSAAFVRERARRERDVIWGVVWCGFA